MRNLFEDWFGFKLSKDKKQDSGEQQNKSFVPPTSNDGAVEIDDNFVGGGSISYQYNLETSYENQADLINQYRSLASKPEVENAIDDIINEAIVFEPDKEPVELNMDNLDFSDKVKDSIKEQFDYVLQLLDFNYEGDKIFHRWFVDGQINYHIVVDNNDKPTTIEELRFIDPRKLQKVREVVKDQDRDQNDPSVRIVKNMKEYFLYKEQTKKDSAQQSALKIHPNSIARSVSGITDVEGNYVFSNLHKALKPYNNLQTLEDSIVIYRLTRAPERRVFYVDTGKLPKNKAEQYISNIMNKFKNKMVYDAKTGSMKDNTRHISMQEDFWLPRPEGNRGTEVQTLQAGQNLGELQDVQYFKKKLYQSLKVPITRFVDEGGGQFGIGRSSEITRDEVKFSKYVSKLRKQFSQVLYQVLKVQLILNKTITEEDWENVKENIRFDFNNDSFWAELKKQELLEERFGKLRDISEYEGTYVSRKWIQQEVLQMTEQEIEDQKEQIQKEISDGLYKDPAKSDDEPF